MTTRRHIGLLLATVLVMGTIVSPLVHFSWMALSGHFNVPHVVTGHDNTAHHAAASHVPSAGHAVQSGAQATTDDLDHLTCDYSSLFGTFSAYEAPAPQSGVPCVRLNTPVGLSSLVDAVASVDSIQLRGPPAV